MNIAVVLRLMPSLGDELEVDDNGVDIDREIVDLVINEFDEQALEEAVLIKEATGATVAALAIAGEGADQALRVAYARGADRVVLVDAGACDPYDARTASEAFAQAVRELASDLVLTGVQTPYDVFGQTAPYLAAQLGWPQASVVVGMTVSDGTTRVVQEYTGGREAVLALTLPAVVGVQSASSPPRYVSMARLRQAMSEASAETISAAVEPPAAAPRITALARPERTGSATMLEGDPEEVAEKLAALLRERGALIG
jgi:electron transfer flavoprotein beta subunit